MPLRLRDAVFAVGLALLATPPPAAAEDAPLTLFRDSTSDWRPFAPHDGRPGLMWEMIGAIMDEAAIGWRAEETSPARGRAALADGDLDGEPASPNWFPPEEAARYVWTDYFVKIEERLIGAPGTDFSDFAGPASLADKQVFTVVNYGYQGVDQWGGRIDVASERVMVQRIQRSAPSSVAICNIVACLYWAGALDQEIAVGPVYDSGAVALRLHKRHAALIPTLDAAIATLRERGAFGAATARYIRPAGGS